MDDRKQLISTKKIWHWDGNLLFPPSLVFDAMCLKSINPVQICEKIKVVKDFKNMKKEKKRKKRINNMKKAKSQ